jgi:hypothetical protein
MIARRWLDVTLALLFAVSLAAVLLAHERDFLRRPFCAKVHVCPSVDHAEAWNKVAYDLGIGGLTSLMFYGLLVRLPDWQRRRRIRRLLSNRYRVFKRGLIATILGVANGAYAYSLIDELLDQKPFRAYFKEPVTQNHERWDRFLNNLEEHHIRELLMTMEIFRDEVNQVLITTDISDIETSEFFKRLSAAIYSHRNATAEYDPVKQFSGFLWTVLSGWDIISGYRERDVVQDMIDAI